MPSAPSLPTIQTSPQIPRSSTTVRALSQGSSNALGAQAGLSTLRHITEEAGFTRFRQATETPNFMVLEARP